MTLTSLFLLFFSLIVDSLAAPKLLICSDSTASHYTSGPLVGWADKLSPFLTISVVNLAKAGASTRSYISLGLWQKLLDQTSPGDYVLIEMGHNDEGDPTKNDKYSERGTLPGLSNGTKLIQTSKGKETVHTFGFYLRTMIHDVQQKSAIPIISGMVPRNYWSKNNKTVQEKWPFDDFAREQAKESGVAFLDHTKYSVMMLQGLGFEKAEKLFPQDRTHTNDEGAKLNAETFVMAIKCGESVLGKWLSDKGKAIRASC